MGDGFGEIVYIFVMIAALVFSIYKKAKAKEHGDIGMPEHEASGSPHESFPSFKDWFDSDDDEEKEPVKPYVETMQPGKLQARKLDYKKPDYQRIKRTDSLKRPERITRITKRIVRDVHKSLAIEDYSEATSYWDDEELDLKKAIIYSEIIKRPTI